MGDLGKDCTLRVKSAGADGQDSTPSPSPRSIDPYAGRWAASGKMTTRRTRKLPALRGANPQPSRARAATRSAALNPPSCTGSSKRWAMPELSRRPDLRRAPGSATAAAGSRRPVGCPWKGDERREELAEADAEAIQAARASQTKTTLLQRYCRAGTPPAPPALLCADKILQADGVLGSE